VTHILINEVLIGQDFVLSEILKYLFYEKSMENIWKIIKVTYRNSFKMIWLDFSETFMEQR